MSAGVEEHDRIVWDFGFDVFRHAVNIDETSRGVVVTVFLDAYAAKSEREIVVNDERLRNGDVGKSEGVATTTGSPILAFQNDITNKTSYTDHRRPFSMMAVHCTVVNTILF